MEDCIFCKIVRKEIPKDLQFEDEKVIAFDDIKPVAATHIVFIPKEHIEDFESLKDDSIFPSIRTGMQKIIDEKKLVGRGFKIIVNGGGAQIVNHLHFHLIGPIGLKV